MLTKPKEKRKREKRKPVLRSFFLYLPVFEIVPNRKKFDSLEKKRHF